MLSMSCEFLSNLVSLTSETTRVLRNPRDALLWVPFKSCIFDIRNNVLRKKKMTSSVVSSFQILYLWHQKQLITKSGAPDTSCELLSNFVSLTSETTYILFQPDNPKLWIAFKFCIFDIRNNLPGLLCQLPLVVNCFQILYLWHQKQPAPASSRPSERCELLSNFVSLTSETTALTNPVRWWQLWIAFKFCIFDIRNNLAAEKAILAEVVNCFQILYLWHQKQLVDNWMESRYNCELLSNFVSLTSETTNLSGIDAKTKLWIAFKFCIFDIRNNPVFILID